MEEQKELVVSQQNVPTVTQKDIDDFLFASSTKLTEQQKAMFYRIAVMNQLNPFKREIYAIAYGDKFNVVTAYEIYLRRAERSGKLDGWEADYVSDPKGDYAWCTVYRKDWSKPLTQKVWLSEFDLGNRMWKEKKRTMLIKVAIATAFRRAFPEELSGLPYTSDEMPMEAEVVSVSEKSVSPQKSDIPDISKQIEELSELKGYDLKEYLKKSKAKSVSQLKSDTQQALLKHLQGLPDKQQERTEITCPESGEIVSPVHCKENCSMIITCSEWKKE